MIDETPTPSKKKKTTSDFNAIEVGDGRECDYCGKKQSCFQLAMQDRYEGDLICPDCYDNL